MSTNIFQRVPVLILAGGVLLGVSCDRKTEPPKEAHPTKEHAQDAVKVERNPEGEPVLLLTAEAQKRVGLILEPLTVTEFSPEIRGYGRVLDPALLAGLVSEIATATVAVENSRRDLALAHKRREIETASGQLAAKTSANELERTRILAQQSNASERALQAADLAAQKDRLQAELTEAAASRAVQAAESSLHRDETALRAVQAKWLTGYGRALLDRKNLSEFAAALAAGQMALVRLDIPAGEPLQEQPIGATLVSPADAGVVLPAQLLGPAGSTDLQTQGQGFLVLLMPGAPRLAPGTLVIGSLQLAGKKEAGVTVPRSAIVRHEGSVFIYVETKAGAVTRKEIELIQATKNGWFVKAVLKAGDQVVVTGAQQLLSEESKEKD